MCCHKCLVRISDRYLHYVWKLKKESFEKRPMVYNGIMAAKEHKCNVILINACFARCIAYVQHVRTDFEINRYKIDEFRKPAKIVCFI